MVGAGEAEFPGEEGRPQKRHRPQKQAGGGGGIDHRTGAARAHATTEMGGTVPMVPCAPPPLLVLGCLLAPVALVTSHVVDVTGTRVTRLRSGQPGQIHRTGVEHRQGHPPDPGRGQDQHEGEGVQVAEEVHHPVLSTRPGRFRIRPARARSSLTPHPVRVSKTTTSARAYQTGSRTSSFTSQRKWSTPSAAAT